MLSQLILWSSVILESLLLYRGYRQKLYSRFPAFYCYIAFVLVQDPICFFVFKWSRPNYTFIYWVAEFLCVLLSCGIVFEFYQAGLAAYPGTARMARGILGLLFVVALAKALANDPNWWSAATSTNIESAIRTVQGVAVLALVALFLFYGVPLGRNLRGIVLGYGIFVCWSVICLTFAPLTVGRVHQLLGHLYPALYPISLLVWLKYLWHYDEAPAANPRVPPDQNYRHLAGDTQRRLQNARGYLGKAVRS
jgi:hypothetical protein